MRHDFVTYCDRSLRLESRRLLTTRDSFRIMSLASADDLYKSGNEHLLIDDFTKAISLYTQAIELSEDEKPGYFLKRCV